MRGREQFRGVSFYCDDIRTTVADLREAGSSSPTRSPIPATGHVIHFTMPGGVTVELYEPK